MLRWRGELRDFENYIAEPSVPAPVKRCFRQLFNKNIVPLVWFGLYFTLQAYFAEFGEVRSTSVIRDKDTGLSKGFGFVSMQASEGAKKALLRQVLKDTISSFPSL